MINPDKFYASVRKSFGKLSQKQVNGFNVLLMHWRGQPTRYIGYGLATGWHETDETMQPIREYGLGKGKKYGTTYYGRGFVQLTWEENYKKAGKKLGYDFVTTPDLVMMPGVAAEIMVRGMTEGWFTGKKLSDY